ncbi:MAG: hypothetical protein AAB498_01145, partial [Patescibacteria group bacterium]
DNALIFLAGLILSLNIFVRLPNVLGLLFFLAIPFSAHIKNTPLKAHLKQYFVFTAGALLGFAVAFFAMKTLGHFDYYIESLRYLIGATQINHGPYSDGVLLTALAGYPRLFFDAAVMFFLAVSAIFLYFILKFDRINFFIKLFLLTVFSAILYAKYDFIGVPIGGRVASLLTGLCYAVFAVRVLNYKKGDNNLSIVVLLMLILLVIIPLGSGAGFVNSLYIIPVAFPIVFSYIRNFQKTDFSPWMSQQKIFQNISLAVNDGALEKVKVFLLAAFILYAIANAFAFSYDDSYNRFSLNAGIDHKYLKGIYTTKERAAPLNELISELPKYVQGGDTLLVAWIAPMIYYLTETKPYFPHPWTEIYARDQIVEFLGGGRKNGELPVVIRYNYSKKHEYDDILYKFLGENSYEKKWNNDVYEIYAPNL